MILRARAAVHYTLIQETSNFPLISTIGNKNGNSYTVGDNAGSNQCA